MANRYEFTTPVVVTENAGFVKQIVLQPSAPPEVPGERPGRLQVVWAIGNWDGATFTETRSVSRSIRYQAVAGTAIEADLDALRDAALQFAASQGIFPPGSIAT